MNISRWRSRTGRYLGVAATIIVLSGGRAALADDVCGHEVSPRLQVLEAYEATDARQGVVGGGTQTLVIYPGSVVHVSFMGTYLNIGAEGQPIPFVGGSFCGSATDVAVANLNQAMQQLRIGTQGDCYWDNPNLLKPSAAEYRVRWFGRAGRTNQFRISSRPDFPACRTEIQSFIEALGRLMTDFRVEEQIRVEF